MDKRDSEPILDTWTNSTFKDWRVSPLRTDIHDNPTDRRRSWTHTRNRSIWLKYSWFRDSHEQKIEASEAQ